MRELIIGCRSDGITSSRESSREKSVLIIPEYYIIISIMWPRNYSLIGSIYSLNNRSCDGHVAASPISFRLYARVYLSFFLSLSLSPSLVFLYQCNFSLFLLPLANAQLFVSFQSHIFFFIVYSVSVCCF